MSSASFPSTATSPFEKSGHLYSWQMSLAVSLAWVLYSFLVLYWLACLLYWTFDAFLAWQWPHSLQLANPKSRVFRVCLVCSEEMPGSVKSIPSSGEPASSSFPAFLVVKLAESLSFQWNLSSLNLSKPERKSVRKGGSSASSVSLICLTQPWNSRRLRTTNRRQPRTHRHRSCRLGFLLFLVLAKRVHLFSLAFHSQQTADLESGTRTS